MYDAMCRIPGLAALLALASLSWSPAASGQSPSPVDADARYAPVQSISYEFGSKMMSGYFVDRSSACLVTLMIAERSDDSDSPMPSPTRVRLVLYPGQIAGLDSDEGRSLNFTCGEEATTLLVRAGQRDELVAVQAHALTKDIAKKQ